MKNLEDIIYSERYELLEHIGSGCWGAVYKAHDKVTDRKVAIKVFDPNEIAQAQMEERDLDMFDAMKKEASELEACSHIVPRKFELDKQGNPFIVMPLYQKFFSDILHEGVSRLHLNYGLHLKKIMTYAQDLAKGLAEIHSELKRAHGDFKPDNIAVNGGERLMLCDLGASTCAAYGLSDAKRSNIGFLYTRAPECFDEESHPTKKSDVWAFGSLLYRLFTGKYVLEEELENAKDPIKYVKETDPAALELIIKNKIKKNIPKKFQDLVQSCLYVDESKRLGSGTYILKKLSDSQKTSNLNEKAKIYFRKLVVPFAIVAGLSSLLVYLANIHEPKMLGMPPVSLSGRSGLIGPPELGGNLEFVREFVPKNPRKLPDIIYGGDSPFKSKIKNRSVSFFLKTYCFAVKTAEVKFISEIQQKVSTMYGKVDEFMYEHNSGMHLRIARNIEVAITKSILPDGRIDLEDTFAIARLGEDLVRRAQRAAGSFDFQRYIVAKDVAGEYIIPKEEQKFLKTWLEYSVKTK